jgi:signal transduction histidine kinase
VGHSVNRAASLSAQCSPVRATSGSEPRRPADDDLPVFAGAGDHQDAADLSSIDSFALPLLPVRSARELLLGLARNWQRLWDAQAAVVSMAPVAGGKRLAVLARRNGLPEIAEAALSSDSPGNGFPSLTAQDPLVEREGSPDAVIRFPASSELAASVLLYGPRRASRQTAAEIESSLDTRRLAAWSGKLIEQAAVAECRLAEGRALQAAKMAALAEFAAGAGHEINNPLATIAGRAQLLLRGEKDPERKQGLAIIGAQALRIRDMIGDLMLFARPPLPSPQRLSLSEAVRRVVERFAEPARARACRLTPPAAKEVFATADPAQFSVVVSELVRNSLEAIDSGGEIRIDLESAVIGETTYSIVSISDNGPGLTERDRAHLFDPFYSGRDAGRGLGFGLCKCWRILERHGGWIEVDSVPRVATTFRTFWLSGS